MPPSPSKSFKEAEGAFKGLSALIPEFHFDLISRILPGAYLALGLANACSPRFLVRLLGLWGPWGENGATPPLVVIGVATLAVGYVVGLMLTALELSWHKDGFDIEFRKAFDAANDNVKALIRLRFTQGKEPTDWVELHRHLQDDLKEEIPRAAALLPKMRAEEKLFSHLELASYLLVALTLLVRLFRSACHLYPLWTCSDWGWTWVAVIALFLLGLSLRFVWRKRLQRYLQGVFSYAGRLQRVQEEKRH